MAFPDRYLSDDEELVLDLRPHWWVFAAPSTALVVLVVLVIALRDVDYLNIALLVALLAGAVWLTLVYTRWATTNFVVTSERLIYRSGVLAKNGIEIPLDRVNNVIFRQSLFERVMGAGDLVIESAGESGRQSFSDVRKPMAVQHEIYRQMDDFRERQRTVVSGGPSIPEQIAQLADLHERGILSDAEFAEKKQRLLDQL